VTSLACTDSCAIFSSLVGILASLGRGVKPQGAVENAVGKRPASE